jgi:N-acetyl-gamma-glutamyl-phosphate reductase
VVEMIEGLVSEGERPRVLVAGATGYTGALAAALVQGHPGLDLVAITGRSHVGERLDRVYPRYPVPLEIEELDNQVIERADAGLVAYPHGAAAPAVAELRGLGLVVVDLSADFRFLELPNYEKVYGEHGAPDLLDGVVYGLPELDRESVAAAELVANPGCYPTAALLGLAPLVRAGLAADVVIDAKSGTSGAGREAGEALSFVNVTENVRPYSPAGHRHRPEILEQLARIAPDGQAPPLTFVPHLLPIDQGELVSAYVATPERLSQAELDELYREAYGDEQFVELVDSPPGVRDVRETNRCRIQVLAGDERVVVFSAIDNLWKGAASQAIQNLNLMLGLPEGAGLR